MSYRFERGEATAAGGVSAGIRRIALEQIDKALSELLSPSGESDKVVHTVRKRFKKVRAVLRLVRDALGEEVYKSENVLYRDAGRKLSSVRDSAVVVETLDQLAERFEARATSYAFDGVRSKLVERHDEIRERVLDDGNVLHKVALVIQEGRPRVKDWPIQENGFEALRNGLKRVYKRGRRALKKARAMPTTENVHELRKRAKYLWYQMRMLGPAWPELLEPLANEMHALSDYLGENHDLALLSQLFHERPDFCSDEIQAAALLGMIAERWTELQDAAWPLAERIYVEKRIDFVERIGGYWHAWQAEGTDRGMDGEQNDN